MSDWVAPMGLSIHQSASPSGDTVYWPERLPPRGGRVCLHGSDGGFSGWNDVSCLLLAANLLAANGFVALAHSYNRPRQSGRAPGIDSALLDGTEAALAFLKQELAGHRCGVGLFGYSRGAEHALLAAQLMAEDGSDATPSAVAVHSPQDAIWPAFILSDFETGRDWDGDRHLPAWTWRGNADRTMPGTLWRGTTSLSRTDHAGNRGRGLEC
ncbi:hypothetical protein [Lichenifustis flavocetrariae]|uniref:Uncharacterized protein n=1 Tax=Lichenifustis flavocetrariae TaxID=2949735 RepID=A0AA42CR44_9HYPH|nr:hypothetical protein [Lichenifustis flavocetrariae]MCW6512080.1 hypothetical protein [Lichenifustis flavocetrariae]